MMSQEQRVLDLNMKINKIAQLKVEAEKMNNETRLAQLQLLEAELVTEMKELTK